MRLHEVLNECNSSILFKNTVDFTYELEKDVLGFEDVLIGTKIVWDTLKSKTPDEKLRPKYSLFFDGDFLGSYCCLMNNDFENPNGLFPFLGKDGDKLDAPTGFFNFNYINHHKFLSLCFIPWECLLGLECEFYKSLNLNFVEFVLPSFIYDISLFGFKEPTGKRTEQKMKKLLG